MKYLIFEIVSLTLIVGLFNISKLKNTIYIYFILLLFATFIVELLNVISTEYFVKHGKPLLNTGFYYNLFITCLFPFFFWFYNNIFKKKKNKKATLVFMIIYLFYCFIEFFVNGASFYSKSFNTNLILAGSILLLITLILFLLEIINDKQIIFNITKSLIFWISVGLLLFYIGIVPIMIAKKHLNYNKMYFSILNTLNVIMYGSFIIGFIKSNPKYNY